MRLLACKLVRKIGLGMISGMLIWLIGCTPQTDPPEQLDYRDWIEGSAGMYIESLAATPNARLYNLGSTSVPGIFQYAIKFGRDASQEDSGVRNAILIECGMHGREWFATESCYWLVDHLVNNRNRPEIRALWDAVDIWILPQSNPAGRQIDDLRHGDPTQYIHVCIGGTKQGLACPSGSECACGAADGTACISGNCNSAGWRGNANITVDCTLGVDPARNFSSDWRSSTAPCNGTKYPGPHPFSELEALNLRRFIHNHMISSVLIVHTTSRKTWNTWANSDIALSLANDAMVNELITLNSTGIGSDTEASMPRRQVGHTQGQFSAWLTRPSDAAGELDLGTKRNISTFYFELPISNLPGTPAGTINPYYTDSYDGDDYQYVRSPPDGSNSFHPSSSVWYRLWSDSILPMYTYVIRQAGSPQCPLDDNFVRVTSHCEANDFGLVGMKIARGVDSPGVLGFDPSTRQETLVEGTYSIVFAVQNFSTNSGNSTTGATVEIYRDILGTNTPDGSYAQTTRTLAAGEREVISVDHSFAAGETYRVEVSLDSDDFPRDNTKSMAFHVQSRTMRATPLYELLVEELEVRPLDADALRWVFEGQLSLPEKTSQRFSKANIEVVVFPRRAAAVPRPLIWKAPVKLMSTVQQNDDSGDTATESTQKTPPRPVELHLNPGKARDKHIVRLVMEDPLLAKALAEGGMISMRLTVEEPNIVIVALRPSKVDPHLKVDPKNAEDDVEYEP